MLKTTIGFPSLKVSDFNTGWFSADLIRFKRVEQLNITYSVRIITITSRITSEEPRSMPK